MGLPCLSQTVHSLLRTSCCQLAKSSASSGRRPAAQVNSLSTRCDRAVTAVRLLSASGKIFAALCKAGENTLRPGAPCCLLGFVIARIASMLSLGKKAASGQSIVPNDKNCLNARVMNRSCALHVRKLPWEHCLISILGPSSDHVQHTLPTLAQASSSCPGHLFDRTGVPLPVLVKLEQRGTQEQGDKQETTAPTADNTCQTRQPDFLAPRAHYTGLTRGREAKTCEREGFKEASRSWIVATPTCVLFNKQTDRQTNKQTNRQTNKQQTNKQPNKHQGL